MKDEELAEEYAKEEVPFDTTESGEKLYTEHDLKHAFIAGLKAGRPKWHDLRKNPDALPESGAQVLSEKGDIVVYNRFCWFEHSPNADNIKLRKWEEPIAWCEKPKLEKEDEE